jgi:hypothetical protein
MARPAVPVSPALTLPQSPRSLRLAMTARSRTPPHRSEAGQAARTAREARLAEALRANLKKRKAQSRGRAEPGAEPGSEPTEGLAAGPAGERGPGDRAGKA